MIDLPEEYSGITIGYSAAVVEANRDSIEDATDGQWVRQNGIPVPSFFSAVY